MNLVIFSFREIGVLDDRGRCRFIGFCDIRWFPGWGYVIVDEKGNVAIHDDSFGTILEFDALTGRYYIEILLSEPVPSNIAIESFNFQVAEDMYFGTKEYVGNNLMIQQGVHRLNPNLGIAGGYRIPHWLFNKIDISIV